MLTALWKKARDTETWKVVFKGPRFTEGRSPGKKEEDCENVELHNETTVRFNGHFLCSQC
jgi:hypothetical protein